LSLCHKAALLNPQKKGVGVNFIKRTKKFIPEASKAFLPNGVGDLFFSRKLFSTVCLG
jgi:hypothetical protein